MQFIWPGALWALILVPVLIALYVLAQRRRHKYALRYASLTLVRDALDKGPGIKRHIPPALFILAVAAMLIALARPQSVVTLPSEEGTVILAIDVSGSMQAEDMRPNRMEAAKSAAMTFVDKQSGSARIGVVSFTDNAAIVQAPTDDKEAVKAAISRLRPQRGTAIGRGILTSLEAIFENSDLDFPVQPAQPAPGARPTAAPATPKATPVPEGYFAPATVVLLTDGENNVFPPPLAVVQEAIDRGIRVYTIGLGSPEGTILRIQGRQIRTRLDEATLRQVAELTKAEYYLASNEAELEKVYSNLSTTLVLRTEKTEVTFAFTALAAALSVLAAAFSLLWFQRLP
ncbi:MAG TPA: VWA domain-containing protein [Candidatus Limnocylindria bacterium]|nr:VWA domain-containing protein [Candidatus Limnocylindria bacterium]